MANNIRKPKGMHFEAASVKPPIVNPFSTYPRTHTGFYDFEDEGDSAPPVATTRPRNSQPRPAPAPTQTAKRSSIFTHAPRIPFEGLFRPVGTRHRAAPARRIVLVTIGIALLIFSGYLSTLALQHYIPAFSGRAVGIGTVVAGAAATVIFGGIELMIFRVMGFSWPSILALCGVYVVDIWINLDGMARLSGYNEIMGHGLGTAIVIVTGVGAAWLPEKFISAGWE